MITIQLQKEIKAEPDIVFDLLADHTKHPLWHPYITEATLLIKRPIKKGSQGVSIGVFNGRRVVNEIYYDAYDRPKFVSGGTSSGKVKATLTNEFKAVEEGTIIDFHMEVKFKGFMRLLEPFMKASLVRQYEEALEALDVYITGNRSQPV